MDYVYLTLMMTAGTWLACWLNGLTLKEIAKSTGVAWLLALFSFLPGKHESPYNFDSHVQGYPFVAVFIFAIVIVSLNREKFARRMSRCGSTT